MPDEIPPPSVETPIAEIPPVETPPPVQTEAEAPTAASLVMDGGVTDERIAAATRRAEEAERGRTEAERRAAELERDNQILKEIPKPAPAPKPAKVKRKHNWFAPVIGAEDENE
jgi:hypothetical protein